MLLRCLQWRKKLGTQCVINIYHRSRRLVHRNSLTGPMKMYSGGFAGQRPGSGACSSFFFFPRRTHQWPPERRAVQPGTSLFIFTIFLESFGERGKTGMFMKVSRWSCLPPSPYPSTLKHPLQPSLTPPPSTSAFLFSTWAMKD